MKRDELTERQIEAVNILLAAAAWIAGAGEKPKTNDWSIAQVVADALSECGVSMD